MAIAVWHATDRDVRFETSKTGIVNLAQFEFVAAVATDNLERAFQLTNNIDSNWTANKDVHVAPGQGMQLRSTSVGDLLHTKDGKWMQVASFGFKEVITTEQHLCQSVMARTFDA